MDLIVDPIPISSPAKLNDMLNHVIPILIPTDIQKPGKYQLRQILRLFRWEKLDKLLDHTTPVDMRAPSEQIGLQELEDVVDLVETKDFNQFLYDMIRIGIENALFGLCE
jgi:hypothetical protein